MQDPAIRARHIQAFAVHVADNEVYDKEIANATEVDRRPIVGGDVVRCMSRHDTSPGNNIPVPAEYRP